MTYEEAKQQVAEKYQYEDWATATAGRKPNGAAMDRLIREVCELYARNLANEKVKEDRILVEKECVRGCDGYECFDRQMIDLLPLPYPDDQ